MAQPLCSTRSTPTPAPALAPAPAPATASASAAPAPAQHPGLCQSPATADASAPVCRGLPLDLPLLLPATGAAPPCCCCPGRGPMPPPTPQGSITMAVHRRREGGDPPPPDQSEHRVKKTKILIGKILLRQFWLVLVHIFLGPRTPPPPPPSNTSLPCPRRFVSWSLTHCRVASWSFSMGLSRGCRPRHCTPSEAVRCFPPSDQANAAPPTGAFGAVPVGGPGTRRRCDRFLAKRPPRPARGGQPGRPSEMPHGRRAWCARGRRTGWMGCGQGHPVARFPTLVSQGPAGVPRPGKGCHCNPPNTQHALLEMCLTGSGSKVFSVGL